MRRNIGPAGAGPAGPAATALSPHFRHFKWDILTEHKNNCKIIN